MVVVRTCNAPHLHKKGQKVDLEGLVLINGLEALANPVGRWGGASFGGGNLAYPHFQLYLWI